MKTVNTVTGPVSTDQLGHVLMHEHILSSGCGIGASYPQFYADGLDDKAIKALLDAKAEGYDTVIDAAPFSLGRDVRGLKRLSERTGMHIMTVSGWWGRQEPFGMGLIPEEKLAVGFVHDVQVGCDNSDIKAAMLKASMDTEGCTPWNTKVHHAVAMAQAETGANIMVHSFCPTETPRHQIRLLKEAGADMNKVVVEHILETTDMEFIQWIYDQGVWMGMSRLPFTGTPDVFGTSINQRIRTIKKMLDLGMGDRMLFSHDIAIGATTFNNMPQEIQDFMDQTCPEKLCYIKKRVYPALVELGVDFDYLWKITKENPRKFFEE